MGIILGPSRHGEGHMTWVL